MAFPIVPGLPNYEGNAIPVPLYAAERIRNFHDVSVISSIANTTYEGEIKDKGSVVTIRGTAVAPIHKFIEGMRLVENTLDVPTVQLPIDQGEYFNFTLGDVQMHQMDGNYDEDWLSEANKEMKLVVDSTVLGGMAAKVSPYNTGTKAGRKSGRFPLGVSGAGVALTRANVLQYIIRCGSVLDEANVPEEGRWMVVSAPVRALIANSDLKNASLTGDVQTPLRNGRIGMVDRFTIYQTNLAPATGTGADQEYTILFGHKYGLSFATQITKVENNIRSEYAFKSKWRGLQVWGWNVIKPIAVGAGYVKIAATEL